MNLGGKTGFELTELIVYSKCQMGGCALVACQQTKVGKGLVKYATVDTWLIAWTELCAETQLQLRQ